MIHEKYESVASHTFGTRSICHHAGCSVFNPNNLNAYRQNVSMANTVIIAFFFRFLRCYREILTNRLTNMGNESKARKICLFGTSANPPTGQQGHGGIVRALSDLCMSTAINADASNIGEKGDEGSLPLCFDEIRVVPVYRHMFAVRLAMPTRTESLSGYFHSCFHWVVVVFPPFD